MRATRGIALVITLLAALVLLVVVLSVVGTFSVSNQRIAGNKSEELKAQYAAESGAEQSRAVLAEFGDLIASTRVDLSAGDPAVDHLATRLAAFCFGTTSPNPATLKALTEAIRGKNDYSCKVKAEKLKREIADETLPDAELGRRWMPFFLDYIERSTYEAKGIVNVGDSATVYQEKVSRYWGQVLRGTQSALQRIIASDAKQITRYRIATDSNAGIVPTRLAIANGEVKLTFGSLSGNEQIFSIGEVLDRSGKILAKRAVQIGNEGESKLALIIRPPSYAWYAFFFDRQRALYGENMIVFTDQTVIDGPVHANDYLAFEQGSRPWFGGPVSSAGPSTRGGGIRAYWRKTLAGTSGYETPPPGVDGEHWWHLSTSNPEFSVATDALGKALCYDPVAGQEELCENVDRDGDGQPDPPWEYKRDVNWNHAEIKLPGTGAIESLRDQARASGIYVDGSTFCWAPSSIKVKSGDPAPTRCVGKYLRGEGRSKIQLEGKGNEQLIRIELTKITGWKFKRTQPAYWRKHQRCPRPPGGGGGGGGGGSGGGGGGVERLVPIFRWLANALVPHSPLAFAPSAVRAQRWDEDPSGNACRGKRKPKCKKGCTCRYTCIIAKDVYKRETTREYIVFRYTKDDPYLTVVSQQGTMDAVIFSPNPFNGIVVVDPDDFYVSGPNKAKATDPPPPAIAEFAQITLASPKDFHITGDLAYAKPACTKTPHRDINDSDGDGDTEEVIDRCSEKDYKDAADNLLGIYARNIHLNPKGVWNSAGADLTVHAVLMAYNGEIETRHVQYCWRKELGRFKLLGGMIQKNIGPLNWRRKCHGKEKLLGYRSALTYDRRMLEGLAPPGFPRFVEGEWDAELSEVGTGTSGFWRQVPEN